MQRSASAQRHVRKQSCFVLNQASEQHMSSNALKVSQLIQLNNSRQPEVASGQPIGVKYRKF